MEQEQPIWKLGLAGLAAWRLHEDAPSEVSLDWAPGWKLLTPLGALRLGEPLEDTELMRVGERKYFIFTRSLSLVAPKGAFGRNVVPTPPIDLVGSMLTRLRYAAKQFDLPKRPVWYSPGVLDRKPPADPAEYTVETGTAMTRHVVRTAITDAHLEELAIQAADFEIPIHCDVLLDALAAHRNQDFRTAILYAAISAESYASTSVAEAMKKVCTERDSSRHRLVDVPQAGSKTVLKDPVYELLCRSDKFHSIIHERSLYVLGRSLMIEQPETYRRARMLYSTRNKLAHTGESNDSKTIEISEEGSGDALDTAIAVLRWYGDKSNYVVPRVAAFARLTDGEDDDGSIDETG